METIVCLHGAASRPATWHRLASDVRAAGGGVFAPPLLGHRHASRPRRYPLPAFADDVLRRIDAAGIDRFMLVGHSLGAYTAVLVAQAVPERVTRLVLEEPPVPPRTTQDGRPIKPGGQLRLRGAAPVTWLRCDPRLLGQVVTQLNDPQPDWWAGLARIDVPTLVVAGGTLSHVSQRRQALLVESLPDARLVKTYAGHRVHTKDYLAFSKAVLPFLTEAA